ncbi:MAG TPA: hypothetical protein VJ813_10970 [Vicinamibacterales bacterium]|nr:hypothetical protein [Vicinamibacterales bacterium]
MALALLALASAPLAMAAERTLAAKAAQLTLVELKEPDGQILSYRHLAGSTEVHMRGTRRVPDARIKLKVGSRPGFVELDINRGGISGLKAAHWLGKDFLTYVLWAVSVDGKASNLGEITFQGEHPIAVNLTTPYQTFWLMVTAEPSYAVVDPSPVVVLYSVKQRSGDEKGAITINRPLFFFTHYSKYESAPATRLQDVPNQLLQARKAVELASRSGLLAAGLSGGDRLKEEEYTREALTQAKAFVALAEKAYRKDPKGKEVVQFARTAAQSAENARALSTGAVGGLVVRQMEKELADLQHELAQIRTAGPSGPSRAATPSAPQGPLAARLAALAKQPALWFAVAGWGFAVVLLFRRRTI